MRAATFFVLVCACNPEGPPPVAPVELSVPPLGSASGAGPKGGPPPGVSTNRCSARLAPEPIQTESGCELDERLTRGDGQLLFPCKGDGPVEAVFAEHRFEGLVQGGSAVLHLKTELEWQDRCLWETRQELRGRLEVEDGRARGTTLVWSYTERPVKPGPTGCYRACKAKADIVVE